jgi:hypothetical protein
MIPLVSFSWNERARAITFVVQTARVVPDSRLLARQLCILFQILAAVLGAIITIYNM